MAQKNCLNDTEKQLVKVLKDDLGEKSLAQSIVDSGTYDVHEYFVKTRAQRDFNTASIEPLNEMNRSVAQAVKKELVELVRDYLVAESIADQKVWDVVEKNLPILQEEDSFIGERQITFAFGREFALFKNLRRRDIV